MKNFKRILLFCLAFALLSYCFVSCGRDGEGNGIDEGETAPPTEPGEQSDNGLVFELNSDGKGYTVVGIGACDSADIVIDWHNGLPVTGISPYAFRYCNSLKTVKMGSEVTKIGRKAFEECHRLTQIIHDGDGELEVCEDAFLSCDALLRFSTGALVKVGRSAFEGCRSFLSFECGGASAVEKGAFAYCDKFVEVVNRSSSNSCENFLDYAREVHRGESRIVDKNGWLFYTVSGTNYLLGHKDPNAASELILPEDYNGQSYAIYTYAFYGNENIVSVTIPSSVFEIGKRAFSNCEKLADAFFEDQDGWQHGEPTSVRDWNGKKWVWKEQTLSIDPEDLSESYRAARFLTSEYDNKTWIKIGTDVI